MGMDDVRSNHGADQGQGEWMSGVAAQVSNRPEDPDPQAIRLTIIGSLAAKRYKLRLRVFGQGAGQLQRVAFAAPKDPLLAEDCRRELDYPHRGNILGAMALKPLRALLVTEGDPSQMTGGYRFHRRMAELAHKHSAELAFVSIPTLPFPFALTSQVSRLQSLPAADVLVLDSIAMAYVGPWLDGRRPSLPIAAMLHQPPGGIDHGFPRSAIQRALDRQALRHATAVMVASRWLQDQLKKESLNEAPIVVPPGRDLPEVAGLKPALHRGREAALLSVANWLPRKGIDLLLEAIARLPADLATLHLVGRTDLDPPYTRKLRRRLAHPDLAERVVVHGGQPPEKVASLYRAADVFVLPSFVEPYGTVYGEAMSFGLPVVGWKRGNLPYLIADGKEGFLVRSADVGGLAAALERLAIDKDLRRTMGEAAVRRAATFPTWEESAALFFRTLRGIVGGEP
jgi:glycosyltransferase involved in cell wall biosynthesis